MWRAQTTVLAKHARAEVLWAHQLEFFVRQVNFNARSALAYSAPAFVLDQVSRGVQNLDKVLLETDALLYGDNTFGTRAMLQLYPSVKDLWAKYACFENGGFYYTIAACEAFNDGILAKTGLLGAVQDFTNLVRANLKWAKDHPDESMDLNSGPAQLMQQYGTSSHAGGFVTAYDSRCGSVATSLHAAVPCHMHATYSATSTLMAPVSASAMSSLTSHAVLSCRLVVPAASLLPLQLHPD